MINFPPLNPLPTNPQAVKTAVRTRSHRYAESATETSSEKIRRAERRQFRERRLKNIKAAIDRRLTDRRRSSIDLSV